MMKNHMYATPVLKVNFDDIQELIRGGKIEELLKSGNVDQLKKLLRKLWDNRVLTIQYSENRKNISFDTIAKYYNEWMETC